MSEPLPPIHAPLLDGVYAARAFYRWMEGIQRYVQVPPEEGSTGTAANYDVGTSGGRVPVLEGGTASQPNTWGGHNVFTTYIGSQVGYRVKGIRVVYEQQGAIADPTGGATVDTEGRAATASILAALRAHGLIAT
jgi:hypothetical protein